jgi:hypothetical protein
LPKFDTSKAKGFIFEVIQKSEDQYFGVLGSTMEADRSVSHEETLVQVLGLAVTKHFLDISNDFIVQNGQI